MGTRDHEDNALDVRKRQARERMAATGETYTQAVRRIAAESEAPAGMMPNPIAVHIMKILRIHASEHAALAAKISEIEANGGTIVDGGQVSEDRWEIRNWRTGALIASASDGLAGYEEAGDRLDPDSRWWHIDRVRDHVDLIDISPTPGLPPSLAKALEEWIGMTSTPYDEIAEVAGCDVAEVESCLELDEKL